MDLQVRWGTEIQTGMVNGHPCRVHVHRPRAMGELLLDAQRWADRTYLVQGQRRLSVRQHALGVARLASQLRRRGIAAGDHVMLLGFNQIEWLTAFWALQCVGAVAVLGNAWWSSQETAEATALVNPVLVIADGKSRNLSGRPSLDFAEVRAIADSKSGAVLVVDPVAEEAPAVVLFTSGTTGTARGVVMSHRSVIANIQNVMRMTGRLPSQLPTDHPGTVSLVTMPLFHLGGFQISILTLLSGGTVVFTKGRFDPQEVLELIQAHKVRAWGSVPTMVSRVIQHPRFALFDTSSVSSVQMGGAPVPPDLRSRVGECFPAARKRGVGSLYGLTEAGGVLAAGSGSDVAGRPGCVGFALPAVEIRIADPDAQGVGEIMARSATAVSGYLGDPSPVTDADGWVASGDLGRLDDDGRLYIMGRSKEVIIRGGENVASLRVENCLRSHPGVADAAVVGLPHPDLGEEVAAAVVLKPESELDAVELRAYAARQLAHFEVPSRWWVTRKPLPTNATGKTNKRALASAWPSQDGFGDCAR